MSQTALGRLLAVLTAIGWGLGWPAMKVVMSDWPPLFARGAAGVAAAVGLAIVAGYRGESLRPPRSAWWALTVAASFNVFAWMGFTALSLLWLRVAEAALLTYTMPIWVGLLAWPVLGERPTFRSLVALCFGVSGLLVLLGPHVGAGPRLDTGASVLPGVGFALAAALLFAFGVVSSRRALPMTPLARAAWLIGIGSVAMLVTGVLLESPKLDALGRSSGIALAYMAIGPMSLCYMAWFGALARIPATTASTVSLLIPVIGAASAAVILGEPFGAREAAALGLTLAGVAVALRSSGR